MQKTLVIGFGNLLMGDDGAGIHAVQRLAALSLPAHVEVVDGGVNSFAALSVIGDAAKVIFIDAMRGGGMPGDIYRLVSEDLKALPSGEAKSAHDFSLLDTMRMYHRMGKFPPVILYGIEPAALDMGLDLSPQVSDAIETVVSSILAEL